MNKKVQVAIIILKTGRNSEMLEFYNQTWLGANLHEGVTFL